ncbi:MAG: radical SAM protein [Firmicutes bacterium]|nr:radical SAM protein [Bacillota bacterium]
MKYGLDYNQLINESVKIPFRDAWRMMIDNPALVKFILKTLYRQKKAAALRYNLGKKGIHVPPFMITSITSQCNLRCQGCYAQAQHRTPATELKEGQLTSLISEAAELGISIIFFAGGEPLIRRDEILRITRAFPKIIFLLFTNGLLMDGLFLDQVKYQRNLIPIVSLEGYEAETDARRGHGVYDQVWKIFQEMKRKNIFYGVSVTVNRVNFPILTGSQFIRELVDIGSRIFFFVEYIPVQEGTGDLIPAQDQRIGLLSLIDRFRAKFPGLFIAFPGDEEKFGGCLAAGRGFIHISPEGNIEPCPFAPYSDASLKNLTLKEALQSEFLAAIRENHQLLGETKGGCALWEKRDLVFNLLQRSHETK